MSDARNLNIQDENTSLLPKASRRKDSTYNRIETQLALFDYKNNKHKLAAGLSLTILLVLLIALTNAIVEFFKKIDMTNAKLQENLAPVRANWTDHCSYMVKANKDKSIDEYISTTELTGADSEPGCQARTMVYPEVEFLTYCLRLINQYCSIYTPLDQNIAEDYMAIVACMASMLLFMGLTTALLYKMFKPKKVADILSASQLKKTEEVAGNNVGTVSVDKAHAGLILKCSLKEMEIENQNKALRREAFLQAARSEKTPLHHFLQKAPKPIVDYILELADCDSYKMQRRKIFLSYANRPGSALNTFFKKAPPKITDYILKLADLEPFIPKKRLP